MKTDWDAIIVEGVIAGVIVIVGVLIAASLERKLSRDRSNEERALTQRRAVEAAFHGLQLQISSTLAGLTDPDRDRSETSVWWQGYLQSSGRLQEIQLHARDFDGADEVARVAKDLYAALVTATLVVPEGRRLNPLALLEELSILPLRHAIYGEEEPWERGQFEALKARIEAYVE